MAKESGLGWTTYTVGDTANVARDIRSATNTLEWSTPRNVLEVTGLDKSAMERLHGLADFSATASGTFDDAATVSPHAVFADLSNMRTAIMTVSGNTLSNNVLFTDYGLNRGDDGSLKWTAPCVLQSGTVPTWT